MDIVNRLKNFINHLNLPVTQFADNCKIPRPTLSQLLNGRNKKVSDELIGKIHEAYPNLSVLWLMFGEGDMLYDSNIETSASNESQFIDFGGKQSSNNEPIMPQLDFGEGESEKPSNNFSSGKLDPSRLNPSQIDVINSRDSGNDKPATTITLAQGEAKKIVNIIVYYSDNSFESFIPGKAKRQES